MHRIRERTIEIIRRRLLRRRMPRVQVSLILVFTGMAGFLTSFSLLYLGVSRMWVRYPVAILIAYGLFLLLLRLWLWCQRHRPSVDFDLSALDLITSETPPRPQDFQFGGGGDFGGGGAGGSWGESVSSSTSASSGGSVSDALDFDLDLGEGCLIVIAVVALFGGLVASLYIIYIAPALLAEILFDGALLAGLYKRVKPLEQRNWLGSAIRRTVLPAILAAIFFTIAGYALQRAVPEAQSIGDVWNHVMRG